MKGEFVIALNLDNIKEYSKEWEFISEDEYQSLLESLPDEQYNELLKTTYERGIKERQRAFIPNENQLDIALLYRLSLEQSKTQKTIESIYHIAKVFLIIFIITCVVSIFLFVKFIGLLKI